MTSALSARGHHDHRRGGDPADLPAHLQAAAAGQHQVQQHDVVRPLGQRRQALVAGPDLGHLQALPAEGDRDDAPDAVVVLDDQHGPGHAAALPSDAALDTARSERRAQNQPRRAPS
jgi:hypothetical protein